MQGWSLSFQRRNRELSVETAGGLCTQGTCWCRGTVPVSLPCETFARAHHLSSIPYQASSSTSCTGPVRSVLLRTPTTMCRDREGARGGAMVGVGGGRNGREREVGGGAGSTREREGGGEGGMRSDLAGWSG